MWKQANPGLGDLVSVEDFEASARKTPEIEFRAKRRNQFSTGLQTWLPFGAWASCVDPDGTIEPGSDVCLGFDGSYSGDSTAIVVVSCTPIPRIEVGACWEKPADSRSDWVVPIGDVEEQLRQLCRRYRVRKIAADPYRWAHSLQLLEEEGLPVEPFPQSTARMSPATARLFTAVTNRQVTHSGDARLTRHIDAALPKIDSRGQRLTKESKHSGRRIDLAVAAVMAFDRASALDAQPMPAIW